MSFNVKSFGNGKIAQFLEVQGKPQQGAIGLHLTLRRRNTGRVKTMVGLKIYRGAHLLATEVPVTQVEKE